MKADQMLKADVTAELAWDTSVGQPAGIGVAVTPHAQREAKNIAVQVKGGVVTLRGNVDPLEERKSAVGTAWFATGVPRVVDQLQVSA